ncbi:MAG TPA: AMIN domain-containing protein, partial [Candidatus Binatia bacterium]|nr:AMIN domain-containing protein [Candidatus Binatia bacterium]
MRRLGGAVVLLVLGVACAPVRSSQDPIEDASAEAAPAPDGATEATAGVEAKTVQVDAVATAEPEPSSPPSPWIGVRDVRVEPVGNGRRLVVVLTRTPDGVKDFILNDPPRLVMDVRGPQSPKAAAMTRFPVQDAVVERVRVATNGDALRVVADLREKSAYRLHTEGSRLVADMGDAMHVDADATRPQLAA